MINTEKPFKGIQPFRLGGNHQGTIQEKWSTLRKPSRGFNPLGWGREPSGYHTGGMINIEKTLKGIQPFRLGGGEPSGYHTGGMINTDKPFKGIQPFRYGGGETSGYHTGGMINTDKPLKGIQPFRLGEGGNHQGTIQEKWSTLRKPSRGFNPLGWGRNHQGTIQADRSALKNPARGFNPLGWGGNIRVPYRGNDQHWENLQGDSTL